MPINHSLRKLTYLCSLLSPFLVHAESVAKDTPADIEATNELLPLSWEELTELKVSSLARQEQTVKNSPAAAFVITSEDIRRSGASSLAEILRMVPGMNVAKVNAFNWAVSARGFNELYANKLQVMMDGRSIFDPMSNGVYWGQQNTSLQDIERIEVIRGPSGSLWGANAVNGTVNIVTRMAQDTQGGLLSAGGGTEERGFGGIRYGQKLSDSTFLRGTLNALSRDSSANMPNAGNPKDYGNAENANFRLDSDLGAEDKLMLEANLSHYRMHNSFLGTSMAQAPYWQLDSYGKDGSAGSLQSKWSHQTHNGHSLQLNMAYTHTEWEMEVSQMKRSEYALDFQDSFAVFDKHKIIWGLNYQAIDDSFVNTLTMAFNPSKFTQHNVGLFLQDQVNLTDQLQLTAATRVEHFTYTGWETEPNARLLWTPHKHHQFWAGVSRAVTLPNRAQQNINLLLPALYHPRYFFAANTNQNVRTENVVAYELGWRWQISNNLNLDSAFFYNIADRVQTVIASGAPYIDPSFSVSSPIVPTTVGNYRQVKSYGMELSLNYRINHDWRMQASYSGIHFDTHADPNQPWFSDPLIEQKSNPQHSLSVRSMFNLTDEIELDAWARYVDKIEVYWQKIPGYVSLDLRLGWHPLKNLEISLVGQNLLDNQHPEFNDLLYIPVASQIQRGFMAQFSYRF